MPVKQKEWEVPVIISTIEQMLQDMKYDIEHTRHPKKKRQQESSFAFFTAVRENLIDYQQLKKKQ
jgi:hypothetical protein